MIGTTLKEMVAKKLSSCLLTDEWRRFSDLPDAFRVDSGAITWCTGWGRMIDGKRVFVILAFNGQSRSQWRLYIDDVFSRMLEEVVPGNGSHTQAMYCADKRLDPKFPEPSKMAVA